MKNKREPAADSDAKRRRSARSSSPDVGNRPASDQQAGRRTARAAPNSQGAAANPWDPRIWAQDPNMPAELAAELQQEYEHAMQPSEDGCWTFVGQPLPKDAVMVHYSRAAAKAKGRNISHRPGFFQDNITTLQALNKAAALQPTSGDDVVPLFHFEGIVMEDKDKDERFEVHLGSYVIIKEEKRCGKNKDDPAVSIEEMVGRVTEIFYTLQGERRVRLHWMYRDVDTALAATPMWVKESKKDSKKEEVEEAGIWKTSLPVGEFIRHPRMLWISGSEEDNDRYCNCYSIENIDRPVRVFHIPPKYGDPGEVPNSDKKDTFDERKDFFYYGSTTRDFLTFEDVWEDWLLFSPCYKALWEREGVQGIEQLWQRCKTGSLSDLMRGFTGKKLNHGPGKRKLHVLELFAGGGGLSYIAQHNDKVAILHGYANDINNSAAATYTCNNPDAFVSCTGLEEYTQLLIKFGDAVQRFLGEGWQCRLAELRNRSPGRKYSRLHMPDGVGCFGNTMGQDGTSADAHLEAAQRAQQALDKWRRENGVEEQHDELEPDWEAIIDTLAEVEPGELEEDEDQLPQPPDVPDTDKKTKKAFKDAVEKQRERIEECRAYNAEHGRAEVVEIRDVRVTDTAVRVNHGSNKKQMAHGLEGWQCWLEYEVKRERTAASKRSDPDWVWEHQALLWSPDAIAPMRHFMLRMLHDKTIPLPGDVQVLTGGPPCQNVSGLNRHAKQQEVLHDPKNRLVIAYMRLIEYLQPSFIFMEQVTDVYKKEKAMYARYALIQMLSLRYQVRTGICTAGNYGAPQGRLRAVFWGAKAGEEQLPPFPARTHKCKPFGMAFPMLSEHCRVQHATGVGAQESESRAHPITVAGDVLSDLQEVDNFAESDRLQYSCPAEYIAQAYLRRQPREGERSLVERSIFADAAMEPWQQLQQKAQEMLEAAEGQGEEAEQAQLKVLAVGKKVLCQNKGSVTIEDIKATAAPAASGGNKAKKGSTAAPAAASGGDEEDEELEEDEEEAAAAAAALAAEAAADGDDDADTAAEAAEMRKELKESRNFANETWKHHLVDYSKDEVDWEILNLVREAELHNTQWMLGQRRLAQQLAARGVPLDAPLRDQRPLMCNVDDYLRMCAVPKEKGANFRDMPGVITHNDKTNCAGCWHAAQYPVKKKKKQGTMKDNVARWHAMSEQEQEAVEDPMTVLYQDIELTVPCRAGGMPPKPPVGWLKGKDGNDRRFRVDNYGSKNNGAWRGSHLPGCPSKTYWGASGDLICPRWCVCYKKGESNGRHGCFGRIWYDDVQPTVVTRAEPHNLQLVHPAQDRVLTIRENARCQGFPDFHVFVGLAGGKGRQGSHGKGTATVDERYMQIGNAVAPPLAAGLGRCLLLAATEDAPVGVAVVDVPDPEYEAVAQECRAKGIGFWCEKHTVDMLPGATYHWRRHNPAAAAEEEATAAAGAGGSGGSRAKSKQTAAQRPSSDQAAAAAPGSSAAAAAAGSSGPSAGGTKQAKRKASGRADDSAVTAAGDGKPAAAAKAAPASGTAAKRRRSAAAAGSGKSAAGRSGGSSMAAGTAAVAHAAAAAAAAGSGRSNASAAAAASGRSNCSTAAGSGRSKRSAAIAASEAIREELVLERTPIQKLAAEAEAQRRRRKSSAAAEKPGQSTGEAAAVAAAAAVPASPAAAAAAQQLLQIPLGDAGVELPLAAAGAAEQTEGSGRSSAELLESESPDAAAENVQQQQQQLQHISKHVDAMQVDEGVEEDSNEEDMISV